MDNWLPPHEILDYIDAMQPLADQTPEEQRAFALGVIEMSMQTIEGMYGEFPEGRLKCLCRALDSLVAQEFEDAIDWALVGVGFTNNDAKIDVQVRDFYPGITVAEFRSKLDAVKAAPTFVQTVTAPK